MSLIHDLSFLAVRPFLGDAGDAFLGFLGNRFGDHTRRVTMALEVAGERAWRSLEFALGEAWWWQRVPLRLAAREEQAFRAQVKAFLDSVPPVHLPGDPETFRGRCLKELRGARKVGLVPGHGLGIDALAARGQVLAGNADPLRHLEADRQAVARLSARLRQEGYPNLAHYAELRPAGGEPLLVVSVRYFFRREVEADPRLAATLGHARQERLGGAVEAGLDGLHTVLKQHGEAAEQLLSGVTGLLEQTHTDLQGLRHVEEQTRDDVRALREQVERQGRLIEELYRVMLTLTGGPPGSRVPPPAPEKVPPPAPVRWRPVSALFHPPTGQASGGGGWAVG
jgi:hypothetical protein